MDRIHGNFYRLTEFQRRLQQGMTALRELLDIAILKPSIVQSTHPEWPSVVRGKLEFRGVYFRYPGASATAASGDPAYTLSGISLTCEPGTVTGIMGASGSGKSTLVNLVELGYLPDCGQILFDGISLTDIDMVRYQQTALAVVHQRPTFFDGTIRQNIRAGNPQGPAGYEEEVARMAGADDFIRALPNGFDTRIGEGMLTLSGGEAQRIAIARALFMRPAILIFDEATASLDVASEQQVQASINQLVQQHGQITIIIIAHRLNTLAGADQIVVMKEGRVVQKGSHAELAAEGGQYAHFMDLSRVQAAAA
jgi:ABC-type multidrug transport system fused ATPase/permease subunit